MNKDVTLGVTIAGAALGGFIGAIAGRPALGALVGGALTYLFAPKDSKSYEGVPEIPKIPGMIT